MKQLINIILLQIIIFEFANVNSHDPEFEKTDYTFVIPLPLFSGFLLEHVDVVISARDIDIHNTQVTFSSTDSVYFDVGTSVVTSDEGKRFYATLTTKSQILQISGSNQFTITATVRLCFDKINEQVLIQNFTGFRNSTENSRCHRYNNRGFNHSLY